jgi:hypothetical protein
VRQIVLELFDVEVSQHSEATKPTKAARKRPPVILAPKDYFIGPIFAAMPQKGAREVTVMGRRYQIGGFHPMGGDKHPPALDVRHARAIFSLLSFRDESFDEKGTRLIRFSFNELCRTYARTNGGRFAREIKKIMRELLDSYIRVTDLKTNIAHSYRLIERIDIEDRPPRRRDSKLALTNQTEMWFNGCVLSPEFAGLLSNIQELQQLKLYVFTGIRSPLAQAIYLYIPSRACHATETKPFEITLTRLLEQVSFPVPHQKNRRRQIFTQNRNPIIKQLDGLETVHAIFRVRLAETNDGSDWKLQAWVENDGRKPRLASGNSKLIKAWLASGRTRELLDQRLAIASLLTDYEIELMEKAEVRLEGNERFFALAKAMLSPTRFVTLLAEAKGDALEGRKAKKNPTARLIWRIITAIATPIQSIPSKEKCLDN